MSETLLIVLTVLELAALVVVLAIYLLVIRRQLHSVAKTLQDVTWGARAVERQLRGMRSNASNLNWGLEELTRLVPAATEKAQRYARRRPSEAGGS